MSEVTSERPASGRVRLVVLFGGQSAEHDVSCVTAKHVVGAADPDRYDLEPVGITRDGRVGAGRGRPGGHRTGGRRRSPTPWRPPGRAIDHESAIVPTGADDTVVVFPLLHGPMGEDGTVQGLLEQAGVPYVGAGVLGSAVAMDKAMAKDVLAAKGIPQARWLAYRSSDLDDLPLVEIEHELGLPCFVKPANLGSSVGVSKARDRDELARALELAFSYDEWVVVEEAVVAREIELAVLGNTDLRVSVPGEVTPAAEFYDYEDKYLDGRAELTIPADLPPEVAEQFQDLALQAYRALRAEGMARVDFLYEEGGRGPLLNEINTIPGFTPISMYPKLWAASGLPYDELIDELVALALERHERRTKTRRTSRTTRDALTED